MHKIILILFMTLMSLSGSQTAYADNYLLNKSYFEDKSNSLSFEQIEQQKFTAYQNTLTRGYQSGTYWIRLGIAANTQDLVLKIRPIFTEEIELFDPVLTHSKPMVGNKQPSSASDIDAVSYNFLLPPSNAERDVYLRIKSIRSYLVNVEVMDIAQYRKQDRIELMIYTGYTALTFLLALWLFVSWLLHRELVLGAFTVQQFIAFLHTLLHSGLAKFLFDEHLGPIKTNQLFSTLVVIYPFVGILANQFLLQEYGLKKSYRIGFNFLLTLSIAIITLHLLTNLSLTFNLNSILVFITIVFFLISSVFGVDLKRSTLSADALSIHTLRVFYAFNILLWSIAILPLQGILPGSEIALHSLHIYSMLSGLLFFIILQHRAKALLRLETRRASALKTEAEHERHQREEQSMLMAMLSHEIKTPLSVLKLVVDEKVTGSDLEGHANRAVSDIDFIVDRCLQLGRVDAKAMHANKQEFNLDRFFKRLIAEHSAEDRAEINCPPNLVIQTDPEILRVVTANLLENALKYSPSKTVISIAAKASDSRGHDGVQIIFTNETGLMGEPDPQHVFKKYYRNASATKISGSGLGLYLVRELVMVLGGTIDYQPLNKRVEFAIWIPT